MHPRLVLAEACAEGGLGTSRGVMRIGTSRGVIRIGTSRGAIFVEPLRLLVLIVLYLNTRPTPEARSHLEANLKTKI